MKTSVLGLVLLSTCFLGNAGCTYRSYKDAVPAAPEIVAVGTPFVGSTKIDTLQASNLCADKELAPIWEIISKDDAVRQAVANGNDDADCSDYTTVAKRIDLNNDGTEELFVEGIGNVAAASTKPIWVVGLIDHDWKVLLREQGEMYEIKKSLSNNYRDLFFPSRRNVYSQILSSYKFDGGQYQRSSCQIAFFKNSNRPIKTFSCKDDKKIDEFESKFVP